MLQLDCPDDAESYIHRVGRTARHRNKGNGLLVLLPNEVPGMLKELDKAKVPTKQIKVNQKRAVSAKAKISAEVAADPELRHLAKKAFTSYMRSVHLQPNKDIFDVHALPTLEYAQVCYRQHLHVGPLGRVDCVSPREFVIDCGGVRVHKTVTWAAVGANSEVSGGRHDAGCGSGSQEHQQEAAEAESRHHQLKEEATGQEPTP